VLSSKEIRKGAFPPFFFLFPPVRAYLRMYICARTWPLFPRIVTTMKAHVCWPMIKSGI